MAKLELTPALLAEAKQILAEDPPDDSEHEQVVLFVDRGGDIVKADTFAEFRPGMSGHFSVAPKVYAISIESSTSERELADVKGELEKAKDKLAKSKKLLDEDEREELEERISALEEDLEELLDPEYSVVLTFSTDWSMLEENEGELIGALVFPPTKDGKDNFEKSVTLHSSEELKEFMLRWALTG